MRIVFLLGFIISSTSMLSQSLSTEYANLETIVLQIQPSAKGETMRINNKYAPTIYSQFFISRNDSGGTLSCSSTHFQEYCSLAEGWIEHDQTRYAQDFRQIKKVTISTKENGKERLLLLPLEIEQRLYYYFRLDISHNKNRFKNFDCYAFTCLLANVKYSLDTLGFTFFKRNPIPGDIVVLTNSSTLPLEPVFHWALYLGNNLYLSKFGRTNYKTSSTVHVMNLEGMMYLYEAKYSYVAEVKTERLGWAGYTNYERDSASPK